MSSESGESAVTPMNSSPAENQNVRINMRNSSIRGTGWGRIHLCPGSLLFRNVSNILLQLCSQQSTGGHCQPCPPQERVAEILTQFCWMTAACRRQDLSNTGECLSHRKKNQTKAGIIAGILILLYHTVEVPLRDGAQLMTKFPYLLPSWEIPNLSLLPCVVAAGATASCSEWTQRYLSSAWTFATLCISHWCKCVIAQ